MKRLLHVLVGAIGALLVALHFYSGVYAADTNLSATAPSTNADGSALTDLTSIRVYRAIAPNAAGCATATYSVLATVPFTMAGGRFGYLDANQTQNGTYCYKLTALDSSANESVYSNIATKAVDLLFPSAPTGLTAT